MRNLIVCALILCGALYAGTTSVPGPGGTAAANTVMAGPTTGADAVAAYRALVIGDVPLITAAKGGTGVSNAGTLTNGSNTTISNGGIFDLGGYTFTVPATGTAALLNSPTFTGTPAGPTATAGSNTSQLATTAYVLTATPNYTWRTILQANGYFPNGTVVGPYWLPTGGQAAIASGGGSTYGIASIYIFGTDYPDVNGNTAKLRLRVNLQNNATVQTTTFTAGLYPIGTIGGGAGGITYNLGTLVTGSTVAFTTPGANSSNQGVSSEFALPTSGVYVIAVVTTTATTAANTWCVIHANLQMSNVP